MAVCWILCITACLWILEGCSCTGVREPLWMESNNECGGVLVAESGIIRYKLGEPYSPNEMCTWMIRANRKSTIRFSLISSGFKMACQGPGCGGGEAYINISEFEENGFITGRHRIYRFNHFSTYEVKGAIAYVTFRTIPEAQNGTGFALAYGGYDDDLHYRDYNFKEYYITLGSGSISYPEDDRIDFANKEIVSYLINPKYQGNISVEMNTVNVNLTDPATHCSNGRDHIVFHRSSHDSGFISPIEGGRWCQTNEAGTEIFPIESPSVFVATTILRNSNFHGLGQTKRTNNLLSIESINNRNLRLVYQQT